MLNEKNREHILKNAWLTNDYLSVIEEDGKVKIYDSDFNYFDYICEEDNNAHEKFENFVDEIHDALDTLNVNDANLNTINVLKTYTKARALTNYNYLHFLENEFGSKNVNRFGEWWIVKNI